MPSGVLQVVCGPERQKAQAQHSALLHTAATETRWS
jgi:hypothetical protein